MDFHFGSDLVTVNTAKEADLWRNIRQKFETGEGFALATLNLDHLVKLSGDSAFRKAYSAQDLIVADGNPIVWLSKLAKAPVELMPGSELILPMAKIASEVGINVALVGSTQEALKKASKELIKQAHGVNITVLIAPDFGFDPEEAIASGIFTELNKEEIGLCFIALGAPKQEKFAELGREKSPNVGFVSIGAGLDFLSGDQNRAPRWVRVIAMEWAWRMLLSPRRLFMRYLRCFAILPRHTLNAYRQRIR